MCDHVTLVISLSWVHGQTDGERTQGLEVRGNEGRNKEMQQGRCEGGVAMCGKKTQRWRSMVVADSGYQQPTRSAKQPMLR